MNTSTAATVAKFPSEWADGSLDLNLLVLFFQVVNTGSISRAAVRLRVPKATLSRKLRQLEEQVGAVLLKRGPQRLEVTDIGRALHEHCERITSIASDASQIVSEMQSGVRGSLRVALPFGLANTAISQGLAQFARRFPEVRIYAQVCNRWVDVSEESYDVAIHIGTVPNPDLPMRRLASLPRGFFAAPDYLTRRGTPLAHAELLSHDCIAMDTQVQDGLWSVTAEGGASVPVPPHFATTDIVLAREMALAGMGIAMLTLALTAEDVRTGRLVRVLPEVVLPPVSISAVYLERRYMPVRIRAFIDMMAESISGADLPRSA